MSNGIGKNPLTDISKVYLQQIANEGTMDIKGFAIPKSEQDAAKKRVEDKTKKKQMEKGISSAGYTKEGLDPVNPVAVKKKFADRKDKDIDNDGDVDDSDKFLHKRRKAVSKAMGEEITEEEFEMMIETLTELSPALLKRARDAARAKSQRADDRSMKMRKLGKGDSAVDFAMETTGWGFFFDERTSLFFLDLLLILTVGIFQRANCLSLDLSH